MGSASKALSWCGRVRVLIATGAVGLSLAACATAPTGAGGVALASPRYESVSAARPVAQASQHGTYKLGAPYQAAGLWYVPAEDRTYDETGQAGVYGDTLAGKSTANGERFDARMAAGAHATLPMPAIVEVTNLENGRTLRVRLNDRGATKPGRVIDLTRGASEQLGFAAKGSAKVRVRYIGPARLDHPTEPLFIQAQYPVQAPAKAPPTPAKPALTPAESSPLPSTVVASAPAKGGAYAVQAGAFSDPARAEQVAMSLARAGAAAVRPVQVSGRQLYRVVVGSWSDQDSADAARIQVAEMGFADARVVRPF